MTIDAVIKTEKEVVEQFKEFIDTHIMFTDDDGNDVTIEEMYADDTEIIEEILVRNMETMNNHRHIVEWLEELQRARVEIEDLKIANVVLKKDKAKLESSVEELKDLAEIKYDLGFSEGYSKAETQTETDKQSAFDCGYELGRSDKYREITSEYQLFTETQIKDMIAEAKREKFSPIKDLINLIARVFKRD